MKLQRFFTSAELRKYMKVMVTMKKWDLTEVGTKPEVFAVAGCDVASMYQFCFCIFLLTTLADLLWTSKQKANHYKKEIRKKISENLSMFPLFFISISFKQLTGW